MALQRQINDCVRSTALANRVVTAEEYVLMRDEKEGRKEQGQTKNKAKQHSTPKAVTFPKKNELHVPVRERQKEGKKEASKVKQTRQSNTAHSRESHVHFISHNFSLSRHSLQIAPIPDKHSHNFIEYYFTNTLHVTNISTYNKHF